MRSSYATILCKLAAVAAALGATTFAYAEGRKPMTLPEVRDHFVCKTRVSFTEEHGTQVSYMNSSGRILLWYPGNGIVLPGLWKVQEATVKNLTFVALCFQYGADTYNRVTKERGGKWACLPADIWARSTVDGADGDVFGLEQRASAAVPFRLSKARTTIADLQKNIPRKARPKKAVPDPGCPAPVADVARDATVHATNLDQAVGHPALTMP